MNARGSSESVVVGHFNGPWGVQGWVRIFSHTRPPAAIFDYRPWHSGDSGNELVVEDWRQAGPRLVARLRGIESPEQAAALGQGQILVPRACLPESGDDHFYWHDLVGLEVINLQDHVFGRVHGLMETGAHDVLDVRGPSRGPVLIPFVIDEFVHQVDLEAGRITVDWPLDWLSDEA